MAKPNSIKNGTWCPKCFNKKEFYLNEIKEIAKKNGGICLSLEYINNKTKLKFLCAYGHEWWTRPKNIKEGT
ncbi:MAG: hypothetical protein GF311_03485 [Candidatus Lokiarchaeota archaeon]|nr:hypothetical protein [Candidatus Lokiarchaeota archaeon]